MKITNIQPGSPIIDEHLNILQDGLSEALVAFIKTFGDRTIVSGCELYLEVSTSMLAVSEGWVLYEGEIIKVPQHFINVANNLNDYLENLIAYTEEVNSFSDFVNDDGSPSLVSIEKLLKFKILTNEIDPPLFNSFVQVSEAIEELMQSEWISAPVILTNGNGFNVAAGLSIGNGTMGLPPSIRVRLDKKLVLKGTIFGPAAAATINGFNNMKLLLTLDQEFRPRFKKALTLSYSSYDIIVFPDGQVCLNEATTVSNPEVVFQGEVV